jgi:SRSO17 transposase
VQVPETIAFATKPRIACDLLAAALDAGVPCAWVLGDALYGSEQRLRRMLEAHGQPYVLAVRSNQTLRMLTADGFLRTDPKWRMKLAAKAWAPHAAGEGSKGLRLYDWARIALPWVMDGGLERWVLIRRNRRDPQDRAYYLAFAPSDTELAELAGAADLR